MVMMHRCLSCGDCAVYCRSTYGPDEPLGIKGKEKKLPSQRRNSFWLGAIRGWMLPGFRAILLLSIVLCFAISLLKSLKILAVKSGHALRKRIWISSAAASKADTSLRVQPLHWHIDLMICTAQGIICLKKLSLLGRPRLSCISLLFFVWGCNWLWGGQKSLLAQ